MENHQNTKLKYNVKTHINKHMNDETLVVTCNTITSNKLFSNTCYLLRMGNVNQSNSEIKSAEISY